MERGEGDDSRKRSTDGGKDGRPSKRHRFVLDEAALRISLTLGWKRETLIRTIGKSGVRGNVTYYSPGRRRPVDASAGIRHRYVNARASGPTTETISVSASGASSVISSSRWANPPTSKASALESRKCVI